MNASEFYRTLKLHIEEAVIKRAAFRAQVTSVTAAGVQIRTYDSTTALAERFPTLNGLTISVGDEVVVLPVGGTYIVLGAVKRA